jgi:hypothetical protein
MKTFQEFLKEASCSCDKRTTVQEFEKLIPKFLPFVFKELKITKKQIPPIHFPHDSYDAGNGLHVKDIPGITFTTSSTWGQTKHTWGQTSQKNRIVVDIKNRHPLDALRTLGHEICHYYQHINGIHGDGVTGSPTENDANARSAVMMRNFDAAYPEVFKMSAIE